MNSACPIFMFLILLPLIDGCREAPTTDGGQRGSNTASYVGLATLGGGSVNVLMLIWDDAEQIAAGSITYGAQTTPLSDLEIDAASDTIRFTYVRAEVLHRGWALEDALGMDVYMTEPSGIADFRLNREFDGHNMSVVWTGQMSSTVLQGQRQAVMTVDQRGSSFNAIGEVNFYESWSIELSELSGSGNAFQLAGTIFGSGNLPTTWQGNYVGFDTINGVWAAGEQGEVDAGEFYLTRSFL